jgi:N-terminal domain of galactosyltransferase
LNVRFAIPRRSDGGWRDRIWEFCRAYWEREFSWPIEEGHHDCGPFNRAAAVNAAAKGEWDVVVILDGDVACDAERVREAAELAHRTGRLTLPYTRRKLLNRRGTRLILAGHEGSWEPFVAATEGRKHFSSIVCVPRPLWDEVGGFDERYQGWGGEDDAFHSACSVLAEGFERLQGPVWHLWHPKSVHRDHTAPLYKAAWALTERYWAAKTPEAMRALLAEDRSADQIVLVCLTNGKRDTLAPTLASAEEMLSGPIGRRVICNDSGRPLDFDGWDDVPIGRRSGYTRATKAALNIAVGSGQPWVFFLEDDFTFNEPIDLAHMQHLMEREPNLIQLSLKRQAWYPNEREAGGIIEAKPQAFWQEAGYVAHRDYWAQNPMLCRRSFLAEHDWPLVAGSERAFAHQIFRRNRDYVAGIYGRIEDPPRCTHTGQVRAGAGY